MKPRVMFVTIRKTGDREDLSDVHEENIVVDSRPPRRGWICSGEIVGPGFKTRRKATFVFGQDADPPPPGGAAFPAPVVDRDAGKAG